MTPNNNMQTYQTRINAVLEKYLPNETTSPIDLHKAMRYAVLGGGKRLRATLVYVTGEMFNANATDLDNAAAAVEFVHAYSLVHDDLPAMDDDDLRHGKPTCHKAFNEALAILVGDALQSLAFDILASETATLAAPQRIKIIATLATAIGSNGMAGGQALDLAAENKTIVLTQLEKIHALKTGALITASVRIGALAGNCQDEQQLDALTKFAQHIGLAFQIQDDILDIESPTEILGKKQGADIAKHKATFPALLGLTAAKTKAQQVYEQALSYLTHIDAATNNLRNLAKFIISRKY